MGTLQGVSIVIPNYNYERFVGQAIESALAQDHPDCEIIVVDDCSTDGSQAVIEGYGDRVRAIFRPTNGGQVAAINAAWPEARHPILIFLDSDDVLEPHAASTIARAWAPDVVKVQFPMASIDADGHLLGHVAPKYPPGLDTETIRRELLRTGTCPASPGSGNAYTKRFLETIAPIGGLLWMDTMLEINAPFHGEVATLTEPLVRYRMHGSNWSQHNELTLARFLKYLHAQDQKMVYFRDRCRAWGMEFDPEKARRRSAWYLQCQMAVAKLSPPGEAPISPMRVLAQAMRAVPRLPASAKQRGIMMAWLTAVALTPRGVAKDLIAVRFIVGHRPRWLERTARARS
jgi:glycosyltransferase involved in cell wall biosynthesis